MTAERWQQVKSIFHSAVECEPATRAEFLQTSCGGDEELRREVELLLVSDQDPGTLLEHPVVGAGSMAAAAPARTVDPMVGRAIGNYIVTGELARGGMGIVYRARHATLPRDAVVKCIRPLAVSEEARTDLRARFRREAHIQCQLDHPHIVRVYEFFASPEEYFLVMEYVHGSSVRSILDKDRMLPEQATALAVQALDGLAHAHSLVYVDESGSTGVGVIHRDIKPANLLVDERGHLKLTDFGIVKILSEGQLTKTAFSPGTLDYMSPEQIRGLPLDGRSDLYSLGVTLYEMLTGHVPFPRSDASSEYDVLKSHIETDPAPVRTLNSAISVPLAVVVTRSLKRDPAQRWQTASEFRDALIASQQNGQLTGVPSSEREFRAVSGFTPRPKWLYPVLALVALTVVLGFWWLGRNGRGSTGEDQASIAVLPFADMSPEKNQEYFSEGLAVELLNVLAKTPGLRVAARTSSFQFGGNAGDSRVIGKKLNVATILEGSVRKQNNRAKVDVQLIQAANGFHLWSDTYNRELNDIFAVQEEIARAVTGALKVTLLGKKTPTAPAKSTNADAYNLYLQGRYFARNNKDSLEKAVGYFTQAIKLDPGFAPAWLSLGEARAKQAAAAYVPMEAGYRSAREAVEQALLLDPNLGEAHAAMGWIKRTHDWDWAGADASYKRALELEPGNAMVIGGAGVLSGLLGRLDESAKFYRRSLEIDPLNSNVSRNAGIAFYDAGRYEEAIAAFKKALDLFPEMEITHSSLSVVYLAQSRAQDALAEAQQEKHPAWRLWALALAYHALRRKTESDANLAELIAKFRDDAPYQIAQVYAFRGEADRAFEWLDRAYALHDVGLSEMKGEPLLKSLERDPRYTAFLRKMRLPL